MPRLLSPTITLVGLILSTVPLLSDNAVEFQSGPTQTALLELYTSEGCSSCPPAEAWLSRLKESPKLWKDFVPVAFHVDYWDYLGWKDPFAAKAWTQRQHDYAAHWRRRSVYTPAFVLDGKEWHDWSGRDAQPLASNKSAGRLTAHSEDGQRWLLRFEPATQNPSSSFDFHAALLGCDLSSDVKAGENRGRKLRHDFAVLALATVAAAKDGSMFEGVLSLKSTLPVSSNRMALAGWVTSRKSLEPLQSLGGWLPALAR